MVAVASFAHNEEHPTWLFALLVALLVAAVIAACVLRNEGYLNLPGEPSPPVGALTNMVVMNKGYCSGVDGNNKLMVTHGRGTVLKDGGYCVSGAWPSLDPEKVKIYSDNPFCPHNLNAN